jgi:hypothetical protein
MTEKELEILRSLTASEINKDERIATALPNKPDAHQLI